jgi:prefoldin subunit 5
MASSELERTLGRLEGKIDNLLEHHGEFKSNLSEVTGRINQLEHDKTKLMAIVGVISVLVGAVWQYILHSIKSISS